MEIPSPFSCLADDEPEFKFNDRRGSRAPGLVPLLIASRVLLELLDVVVDEANPAHCVSRDNLVL